MTSTSISSRQKRRTINIVIHSIQLLLQLSVIKNHVGIVHSFSPINIQTRQRQIKQHSTISTRRFQTKSTAISQEQEQELSQTQTEQPYSKPKWMKCINDVVPKTCALNEAVAVLSGLSLEECNALIEIGAVWLGYEEYYYYDNIDEDDTEEEEEEIKIKYERVLEPCLVQQNTNIRIYPYPRRYEEACEECDINYSTRLLYEDTTFLVFDKPPMLPTQADASNYNECLPGCLTNYEYKTIDNEVVDRLNLCHRVDAQVGGCVVLSKDKYGQKVFEKLQRERKLKKLYLAVTTEPVPVGRHVHYMWARQVKERGSFVGPTCQLIRSTPPKTRRKSREYWVRCVLEVTKCVPINIPHGYTYDDKSATQHYESTIRLVTGRKHQVRAQLSALGCPIIRDSLYGPMKGITLDQLGENEGDEDIMDSAISQCRVPNVPIGLQAHAILFSGIRVKAGNPWWR